MKILKGVAIFAFLNALLGCFDPPQYSIIPEIDFLKIEFVEVGGFSDADSLNLYIDFKDGDGDLGLSSTLTDENGYLVHSEPPYQDINFFVGANQTKTPVTGRVYSGLDYSGLKYTSSGKTPKFPTYVINSTPANAKFITLADQADYNLPPDQPPYTCTAYYQAYLNDTIFIRTPDKNALSLETIVDTLVDSQNRIVLYAALSKWYIEQNPDHYNITVKFLKQEGDGSFTEFDFREAYCTTYDGRFPVLADSKRVIEGTLKYAMVGTGFLTTFSITPIKLVIQIKDRALHQSTPALETPVFTLNDIRK
ncbi:MAG TPA: hypothetical protein VFW11_15400 [Cyclobacteriaceae bacterium]|nr:hypothetical protein [Cyclobacteriaceae bacterium]